MHVGEVEPHVQRQPGSSWPGTIMPESRKGPREGADNQFSETSALGPGVINWNGVRQD